MIPTQQEIQPYIDKGLVNVQKHPTEDLYIYNYSHECQYSKAWDDVTEQCRGLILDGAGNCVARPFRKFFNVEEYTDNGGKIPEGKPKIYDKLDGSLGIMYWAGDRPYIATRGSFTSDQAVKANEILSEKIKDLQCDMELGDIDDFATIMFEIIYPENQIVVNYGDRAELVFIGAIGRETGEDITDEVRKDLSRYFNVAEEFVRDCPLDELLKEEKENSEGYVLVWPGGFRLKAKFETYVKLHRILTGLNEKRVWELLKDGTDIKEYVKHVPEEFEKWIMQVATGIKNAYEEIEENARLAMELWRYDKLPCKDAAIHIVANYPMIKGILFTMLDGRSVADAIWKMVKPKTANAFKKDIDA